MFYEPAKRDHGLPHDPMKALAVRPIGWVTTMSAAGAVNLAPYSFFNLVADDMVAVSSAGRKDTLAFVEEGGDFVCNLATFDLREQMNATSAPLPRGESEFAYAGLTPAPSRLVRPPRVREAHAALECRWLRTVPLAPPDGEAAYHLILGQVVGVHIDDAFIREGRVDTGAMRPILRAGYHDYFAATPETRFAMPRPTRA